jgi:hypothetical protein
VHASLHLNICKSCKFIYSPFPIALDLVLEEAFTYHGMFDLGTSTQFKITMWHVTRSHLKKKTVFHFFNIRYLSKVGDSQ